jgi:DUF1016 N-terminal domain
MEKHIDHSDLTPIDPAYALLIKTIGQTLLSGRVRAYRAAEQISVQTRWEIGRHIVEFEQKGNRKAEYGTYLLDRLAQDLTLAHGKGFSRTNVVYIRKLFLTYPIGQTPSDQLGWSHYCELLTIDDDLERSFYEKQTLLEKWSISELKRQKKSALGGLSNQIFVSKYQLYLPDRVLLAEKIRHILKNEDF